MNNSKPEECKIPQFLPENPSEFEKLQTMGERQKYILCRIQSAQKVIESLSMEIAKDSVDAGILVRSLLNSFRTIEMLYLSDSRTALRIQSEKATPDKVLIEDWRDIYKQ